MYNYYPTQPNRQPSFGLKGRPVSSLEEVRATSIDFDGSVFYFPDLANKRIYTKQINMDGTASLNMYELKPVPKETVNDYITRAEFEEAIKQLAAVRSGAHETRKTNGATYYTERPYSMELRDRREGRSPMSRKMYMESKELHKDKTTQLKDLENYMQELSMDIAEMIDDASPEEKQMLQSKIAALANKIK